MAETLYPGSAVTLSATFSVSGTPTNPTTLTLKHKAPDGTITTLHAADMTTHPSNGLYTYDLAIPYAAASVGEWIVEWRGEGAVVQVNRDSFVVEPSDML